MELESDVRSLQRLLVDAAGRISEGVHETLDGIDDRHLTYRPDADANTISWLLWHLARVQDDHVAHLAGTSQLWIDDDFATRFGLPFDPMEHGYGHTSDQVAQVRTGATDLRAYHDAVHAMTVRYLEAVDAAELERVVDDSWDPPVTAAVRLVSVLADCLQHVGQAGYVRGLAERAG